MAVFRLCLYLLFAAGQGAFLRNLSKTRTSAAPFVFTRITPSSINPSHSGKNKDTNIDEPEAAKNHPAEKRTEKSK